MKISNLLFGLSLSTIAYSQSPIFTNCAPANADLTVNEASIDPYPLCRGQQACLTLTGLLSVPVTSGALLNIVGLLFGSPVYTDINIDLCALLAAQGHPCPVPITLTALTFCVMVKPSAPVNIALGYTYSAVNGGGSTLFCQTTPSLRTIDC
ncbi:hypothetical protein BGZ76_006574 [Entomortierella beljakovae]|nr:hypothetical protein BGZ76_006574 [Entomortierella beljakovae]